MVSAKAADAENARLISIMHSLQKRQEKRMLNEGVSLNVYENKQVVKLTWVKFTPNLECYRKTSYLHVRTLNVIERKGENRWIWAESLSQPDQTLTGPCWRTSGSCSSSGRSI